MPAKTAAPAKGLAKLRDQMGKKYGEERISVRSRVAPYEVISTGSTSLDFALRTGGWVVGRIHEIVGVEGAGKTTLAINGMARAQKQYPDKAVGYIDMESTFDWDWAEANGLNTSDEFFLHVYPDDSEDVSDQIKEMMETGLFSMIVVDSIGGMESKKAFDKDAEEHVMGRNAQVITRMAKRLATMARKYQTAVLLINQYRADLGNPRGGNMSAGPKALKYATTTKVEMARTAEPPLKVKFPDDETPQVVGKQVRARVTRNKVGPEGRTGLFWIINQNTEEFGPIGIDQADDALATGLFSGVIAQDPGGLYWMPWTEDKKDRVKGRASVLALLRDQPDLADQVRKAAISKVSHEVKPERAVDFGPDGEQLEVDPATGEVL